MEILILFEYLFFFIVNFVYFQADAACPDGWFGSNCQYLCHCDVNNTCNDNGQCSTKCARGWFGQACQYQDLATASSDASVTTSPTQTTTTWLTDGSDTTCNTDTNIQLVKISWNTTYPFTWLRVIPQDANPTSNLTLTFKTASNQTLKCINQQTFNLDAKTVDYRCDLNETIQELTVTGTGLKSLCSLYISGGRNVAIKQITQQTTTLTDAARAVDGNPNGQWSGNSCTHTSDTDPIPSWTLTFDSAKVVNRYVLYNRADCCSVRLKNFKLETMFLNNTVMWTYQDTREPLLVYTVTEIQKNPVSKIRITATNKVSNIVILTLCEVMVFGDCAAGTFGLDCNKTCPQKCITSCHQETGQCVDCFGYSNPPNCTTECISNSLDFGAGIGIGVGIGAASIVLVDLCVICIWFKRNKLTMHGTMNTEGRELENYDRITEPNNYSRPYEKINSLKTNEDLATASSGASVTTSPTQTTTTWLTDGSDTTCNTDTSIQTVKISWNTLYPFTWLRVIPQDANSTSNLILTFKTASNQTLNCINQQTLNLDAKTVDYRCDLSETIQELTITGIGLKSLCSLYISGGRNVAIKQITQQTTTLTDAARAVDGNPNGQWSGNSCTHTSDTDPIPSWTLTFDSAKVVNRYVLYNRADCCSERLKNFKLETMFLNNTVIWTHQDQRETLMVYTVTEIQKTPVSKIRINATNKVSSIVILTLCEVMVFGDCAGTWGLDCNKTCPQKCITSCHQETGECVDCFGYSNPPNCTTGCVYYKWGHNCDNNCTAKCFNHSCNSTTGICSDGCHGYSDPPNCTTGCHTGYYGRNCSSTCSSTCKGMLCDSLTGFCSTCIDGYLGNFCEQACGNHTYGQNCTYNCSSFCSVTMDTSKNRCNHVTGVCLYGCVSGYTTSMCSELISSDDPPAGAIVGPIIAVIVVAILIFVAIILWRRRKAAKRNAAYNGAKSFSQLSNSSQTSARSNTVACPDEMTESSHESEFIDPVFEPKVNQNTVACPDEMTESSHESEFIDPVFEPKKIPSPKNVTLDIGLCEENKPKNRFKNVCPYDHSRVHLKINTAKHEGDYINASYIKGFNDEVTFIASQGPNSIVINDFIRMLWEQKVDKVVMLTNLIEEGK
ncbi:hypothetical protein Btru_017739, partial [Bulinus truncatus]